MTIRTSLRRATGVSAAVAASALMLLAATAPAHATDVNISPLVDCKTTSVGAVGGGITKFSANCYGDPYKKTVYWINGKCNGVTYSSGSATTYFGYGGSVYLNCSSGFTWLEVTATH
ncbi:hypothetical protein ACTWPT_55020 [Nonomuraea sp. 3N208]|uniref:hypothetical protein n=1 Tax=Nonomuraea sp. 3N208 TaxID=3457421 RepID=UPI003FD1F4C3